MIAQLTGTVVDIDGHSIIIDVAGVGYGLIVSLETISNITQSSSQTLYVYEHIREQEHSLYGFTSKDDKKLFEQLLGVNGIGPKAAQALFDISATDILKSEIAKGNYQFLTQATGVGKKAAERVVLDLQDKVGGYVVNNSESSFTQQDEALEGLLMLGYTKDQAQQMLDKVEASTTEERIKLALRNGL